MPLMPRCLHPGFLCRLTEATVVPIWVATLMFCQTSIATPIMQSDPASDSLEYGDEHAGHSSAYPGVVWAGDFTGSCISGD